MNTKYVENVLRINWEEVGKLVKDFDMALTASLFRNAGMSFYTHLAIEHLKEVMLDLADWGLTLPMVSQQGLEQSNSGFKGKLRDQTSPAAKFHGRTQLEQYLQAVLRSLFLE